MFSKSDRSLIQQMIAVASIATSKASLLRDQSRLTPQLLTKMGWIKKHDFYFDKDLKSQYTIYVKFEDPVYRVYFGRERVFIKEEIGTHWFFMFLLLVMDSTTFDYYMEKIFNYDKPLPADPGNN